MPDIKAEAQALVKHLLENPSDFEIFQENPRKVVSKLNLTLDDSLLRDLTGSFVQNGIVVDRHLDYYGYHNDFFDDRHCDLLGNWFSFNPRDMAKRNALAEQVVKSLKIAEISRGESIIQEKIVDKNMPR